MKGFKVFPLLLVSIASHLVNASPVLRNPELLNQPSSEIMVTLIEPVAPVIRELTQRSYLNRAAKLTTISNTLKAFTALSQAPVVAALKPFKVEFSTFWITNKIYIKNANPALIRLLEGMQQVMEIRKPKLPSFPPLNPIEGTPPDVRF